LSHPAVPLAMRAGLGAERVPAPLLLAAIAGSLLPDADVVGFRFGIAYGDLWGHRGLTHSLLFAALVGLVAAAFARRLRVERGWAFAVVSLATASHGLLDAMTDGGLGVALASPFVSARYFLPWRPIAVSPIGLANFWTPRAFVVLASEARWVWLPCVSLALVLLAARRLMGSRVQ
jgi:inner membrane protein